MYNKIIILTLLPIFYSCVGPGHLTYDIVGGNEVLIERYVGSRWEPVCVNGNLGINKYFDCLVCENRSIKQLNGEGRYENKVGKELLLYMIECKGVKRYFYVDTTYKDMSNAKPLKGLIYRCD